MLGSQCTVCNALYGSTADERLAGPACTEVLQIPPSCPGWAQSGGCKVIMPEETNRQTAPTLNHASAELVRSGHGSPALWAVEGSGARAKGRNGGRKPPDVPPVERSSTRYVRTGVVSPMPVPYPATAPRELEIGDGGRYGSAYSSAGGARARSSRRAGEEGQGGRNLAGQGAGREG